MDQVESIQANSNGLYPGLLGIQFLEVTPDRVRAEIQGREELSTANGIIHGGVAMGFADSLGAVATVLNLPEGTWTTTIESKTNFFRALDATKKITGECTPLHKGRTTMVWQTRITGEDGKLAVLVTQTQMILKR